MSLSVTEVETSNFHFVYSCDLHHNVIIKIGTLEGIRERPNHQALINEPMLKYSGMYEKGCSELYVTCQVFVNGHPLALPIRTSHKHFTNRWNWSEWMSLPVRYSDLPRDAMLALTIWDCYGPRKAVAIGSTTVSLFGKHGVLRQGMHDLKVWPNCEADGSVNTKTPGKDDAEKEQMFRLAKLKKKHHNGQLVKVDWLDRLTFREIEMISEREKRNSNFMFLMIEFPQIQYEGLEHSVVYFEKDGNEIYQFRTNPEIVNISDPEIGLENLIESKHHKLARRSRLSDKDLKPNAETRDQLNVIVGYPPTKTLTSEQQDLVWKFRYYLCNQKKALTKFLKCVNWDVVQEVRQAIEQLYRWAPMDVEDALELLSPQFQHPAVRRYAVTRLQQAPDEDLLLYLLQLVQALKYESVEYNESSDLACSKREIHLSDDLELTSSSKEKLIGNVADSTNESVGEHLSEFRRQSSANLIEYSSTSDVDLASFLIHRSCANFTLANYFFWYLHVECERPEHTAKDPAVSQMYKDVMRRFSQALMKGRKELKLCRSQLVAQQSFIDKLVTLVKTVAREKGDRKKKIERLHAMLSDSSTANPAFNFSNFDPLPLPLDPEVKIRGLVPKKATLFKSALMPCRLTFLTEHSEYVTIFKHGDDLRQDQLILQIITLMDKLLRRENLDLKLTPYKVLATSSKHGFVQYIESTPIAEVLATEGSIQNFFRKHSASENGPYGIAADVMECYVKSCAGYCVITYLLGVGDRHFDNLLLTNSGKLFHIDFGYILGRDPKPLPPPMKLSKEMVEAMGGINSEHYQEFRKQCYTAFLHLRRHANLILNLFSLMVDANVPDIALEPDKTVKKVQDKFRLDLTDEEAVHYMQNLIDESVSSVMPALVEQIHKIAQYWRK